MTAYLHGRWLTRVPSTSTPTRLQDRKVQAVDVRVGNYIAPPGGPDIKDALEHLLNNLLAR